MKKKNLNFDISTIDICPESLKTRVKCSPYSSPYINMSVHVLEITPSFSFVGGEKFCTPGLSSDFIGFFRSHDGVLVVHFVAHFIKWKTAPIWRKVNCKDSLKLCLSTLSLNFTEFKTCGKAFKYLNNIDGIYEPNLPYTGRLTSNSLSFFSIFISTFHH